MHSYSDVLLGPSFVRNADIRLVFNWQWPHLLAPLPSCPPRAIHWYELLKLFLVHKLILSVGRLTDRYGPRFIAGTGFLLALPFYVCLRLVTHGGIRQKVLFFALLLLIGAALALISTPIFTEIIHIVYAKERQRPGIFGRGGATGQAYGLFNMAYAAGTIAGPLMTGYIEIDAGWGTMGLSLGLLSAVTSVPVLLLTGGWVGKKFGPRAIGRE